MDTKQFPTNLELLFGVVNCLVVFRIHFNPNNSFLIILQISLLFRFTPALNSPVLNGHQYIERSADTFFGGPNELFSIVSSPLLNNHDFSIRCTIVWHGIYWAWHLTVIYLYSFSLARGRNFQGQFVG